MFTYTTAVLGDLLTHNYTDLFIQDKFLLQIYDFNCNSLKETDLYGFFFFSYI